MRIKWTGKASSDLVRLHEHLRPVAPDAAALGRILAAQGVRFPELGELAVREGLTRQVRLVATVLARFADHHPTRFEDVEVAADLFLSITLGRAAKAALYGVPLDEQHWERRLDMAVDVFLHGYLGGAARRSRPDISPT